MSFWTVQARVALKIPNEGGRGSAVYRRVRRTVFPVSISLVGVESLLKLKLPCLRTLARYCLASATRVLLLFLITAID